MGREGNTFAFCFRVLADWGCKKGMNLNLCGFMERERKQDLRGGNLAAVSSSYLLSHWNIPNFSTPKRIPGSLSHATAPSHLGTQSCWSMWGSLFLLSWAWEDDLSGTTYRNYFIDNFIRSHLLTFSPLCCVLLSARFLGLVSLDPS